MLFSFRDEVLAKSGDSVMEARLDCADEDLQGGGALFE
jgi:hypothetical protein